MDEQDKLLAHKAIGLPHGSASVRRSCPTNHAVHPKKGKLISERTLAGIAVGKERKQKSLRNLWTAWPAAWPFVRREFLTDILANLAGIRP